MIDNIMINELYAVDTKRKAEKKLAGPLAKKELPAEGCSRTGVINPRPGKDISQNTMHYEY